MSFRALLVCVTTTIFFLAGCGGGANPTATSETATPAEAQSPASAQEVLQQTLEIITHDIYFGDNPNNVETPPMWTIESGKEVAIKLSNQGALEHDWAIAKAGEALAIPFVETEHSAQLLWLTPKVKGGDEATVTFTAPAPGIYQVLCTVPGHFPAMQGKLEVK